MRTTGRHLAFTFFLGLVALAGWWTWKSFFWKPTVSPYDDWVPAHATWTFEVRNDDTEHPRALARVWTPEQRRRFEGTPLQSMPWLWSDGRFLAYGTTPTLQSAVFLFPVRNAEPYTDSLGPTLANAEHSTLHGYVIFHVGSAWLAPLKDTLVVAPSVEDIDALLLSRDRTAPRLSQTDKDKFARSQLRSSDWALFGDLHSIAWFDLAQIPGTAFVDEDHWGGIGITPQTSKGSFDVESGALGNSAKDGGSARALSATRSAFLTTSTRWLISTFIPTTTTIEANYEGILWRTMPADGTVLIGGTDINRDKSIFQQINLWDRTIDAALTSATFPKDMKEFAISQDPLIMRFVDSNRTVSDEKGTVIQPSSDHSNQFDRDELIQSLPRDHLFGFVSLRGVKALRWVRETTKLFPFGGLVPVDLHISRLAGTLQRVDHGVAIHVAVE